MFSITFLVLISFLLVNGSSIGPSEKLASQNRQAVEVYYESLCPNSKQFISEQLPKLASGFDQHVKINLIPYGKADHVWDQNKQEWSFKCQHGDEECFGNLIHNCMISNFPRYEDHFPFIQCTMARWGVSFIQAARDCSIQHSVPLEKLISCANSKEGKLLMYRSGVRTKARNLNYVPWIVLNNDHNDYIQSHGEFNILSLICDQYRVND